MNDNYTFFLPPSKLGARIGFFGGSFDPPHLGHMMLSLSFLALEPLDELWIIPCDDHAIKESLSTFIHRFSMCELAFDRIKNIKVLDIEHHLASPNFTFNTIQAIKSVRPDLKLYLGLGSDLIAGFPRWHEAQRLAQLAQFVIFEREHYPCDTLPDLLKMAHVHQSYVLPDTNSTALRKQLSQESRQESCPFVDRAVLSYIEIHGLYR